jgi:Conserved TM helix
MIFSQSANAVSGSFYDIWFTVAIYMPRILAAVVVFLIGWIIATILYRVVIEVVKVLKVNELLKGAGMDEAAKDAGFKLDAGRFLATLVMWFTALVFLVASLEILGLNVVTIFLERIVLLYLPQVIVASLILILGAILAEAVRGLVVGSAKAAGAHTANLAGSVAKYAIWIFAVLAALDQLQVASVFIQTLFTGLVIALSLAFGLAFGLGGKEAAARTIEKIRDEIKHDLS